MREPNATGGSGLRVEHRGDVAILWIDQPERSVALLTYDFLRALASAIDELDADIEACFDSIDHTALMGRVRRRIKDKRVLTLVKVGGIKLGYAYFATGIVSIARLYRAERAVQLTAGGALVGAGAFLVAKS